MLDSVKMNSTGLTPEQELAKSAQARKGIQTSQDGELQQQLICDGTTYYTADELKVTCYVSLAYFYCSRSN